jgi:hypothetical protein
MVIAAVQFWLAAWLLSAAESAEPLLRRLEPPSRAAALMAILGLVLLGLAMVICVMIGGRWVRRIARHDLGPTRLTRNAPKDRLRSALGPILPSGNPGETTIVRRKSDDTVADG